MKFSKYHGCGNDFIIVDYDENIEYSNLAQIVCPEHLAIGADGLIVVKNNPLEMLFYNRDGSRAPMCGNGIRAFARYAQEKFSLPDEFTVKTLAGDMIITVIDDCVRVNMGKPIFTNDSIKASDDISFENREIEVYGKKVVVNSLFMGTIHTVVIVDDLDISDEGEGICNHNLYKEKTNVNFVKILDRNNIEVLTYERGVGFTYACGTGCCASYVVLRREGLCNEQLNVHLKYGKLVIEGNDNIFMTGPAVKVFEGEFNYEN